MHLLDIHSDPTLKPGPIVTVTKAAEEKKATILFQSGGIVDIRTPGQMEDCNPILRSIKACLKEAEESREALKKPVLSLGKEIDQAARAYKLPLQEEEERIKALVAEFIEGQRTAEIEDIRENGESDIQANGGAGISAVDVWDFEILDARKAYEGEPKFFDLVPKKAEIIAAAKSGGLTPFIRVFKTTGVRVKA